MFSIPVAGLGVVGSLLVTGTSFSMQAYIGVIMLAGIVVSNAILLVDYINTLRRRDGVPLREAVEVGGRRRLRPILMTSTATILGLMPMAIGLGEGGELQAPLARVVIGGGYWCRRWSRWCSCLRSIRCLKRGCRAFARARLGRRRELGSW